MSATNQEARAVTTKDRPRLLLIDGHSMAYRAFYALPDSMATSTGQVTNAVYGFASMLTKLLATEAPTHVAVAFDKSRDSFRTQRFAEYKATRAETPEAFGGQVPLIKELLAAMRITALELDEVEADDVLATLATLGAQAGMEVLVCSGDRDTLQLVDDAVTVLYPVKGVSELTRMTPQAVSAKYGVAPANYPDLAALVGESSDNLPGVPGVGPKTAAKWLTEHGSLDALLDQAPHLKGKAAAALREHSGQVRLNRELNALLRELPLPLDLADLERTTFDREALRVLADSLQFGGLRDRLLAADSVTRPTGQLETSAGSEVRLRVLDPGQLRGWLQEREGLLGVAVTGRFGPVDAEAWTIAVCDGIEAVCLDFTELLPDDDAALLGWLGDEAAPKAFHGLKAATHALGSRGYRIAGACFDTELAAYLCYPDQRGYDLADLVERLLGRALAGSAGPNGQGTLDLQFGDDPVGGGQVEAARAAAILELAHDLAGRLADRDSTELLTEVELPLAAVLARMENTGIAVDADYLELLSEQFGGQVGEAARAAYAAIGREVNLGSPKQLQEVLFDELNMPKTKRTKTGYTTDAAALTELFAQTAHPFLEHLLRHRDVTKLRATVDGLRKAIAPDGRIHTTFQQTIAATGRLSSTDPNLQNIPIRTEAGRDIRRAFVVGAGYEALVTADYSQIEMRIMAHLSADAGLIEAFETGEDLHRYVGARVFGVSPDEVDAQMRTRVKAMSYGLAYGLSAFGLSAQLGITTREAQELMDDYFSRFGHVHEYLDSVVAQARHTGWTATVLGRRRYLPDLVSENRQRRAMAERMALNAPIQGSAADIIKLAMLGVQRAFDAQGLGSRLLLQVHDELLVEVAPGEREIVEAVLRGEMGSAFALDVPLDVAVGAGQNWQEAGH